MPHLKFNHTYSYASNVEGISLPVVLRSGAETVDLIATIDTGASNCLFERKNGEILRLDIERGDPRTFSTAAGRVHTFGHLVSLGFRGLQFESMVYFFQDEQIKKNLLGRTGWLDRVRFGLVHYDQTLFVASYDFE